MSFIDKMVVVVYLIGIVGLGIWAGLRQKKTSDGEAQGYFLAGKTLRWPMIGLALFATNISCVHLVSLAQSGYDTGLLNGNFEWMAAFTLILLSLFFAPFYIRSGVATLPEFLERRYSRACRDWLAVLSVVSAVTIHIGFSFLTGGIVLRNLFEFDMYASILVIAALTGLYTIVGGLLAVVVTEAIQTVVLVVGAVIITWFAWDKMGGWSAMVDVLRESGETSKLSMLRPHGDPSGMPWYSIFLGYPVLGIWYWCADQTIVQRVLGARDENHARVGPLFAGLIKILPVFIFVLPGLFAYTLVKSGRLDVSSLVSIAADGRQVVDSKNIYGIMITQLLPTGLVGVLVAALLAALMSTVAGALNSISTLCSFDLYKRIYPDATEHRLVLVGRITAGIALLGAIGLVPLLNGYPSVFNGLNDVIAHIAPPVTCVFVLGVFWKRASAISAMLTLWIGSALGAVVFLLSKIGDATPAAAWIHTVSGGSFMMIAFYLFAACAIIQISVSLVCPAGPSERASGLYWSSPLEPLRAKGWPGIGNYRFLAILLFALMVILYSIFGPTPSAFGETIVNTAVPPVYGPTNPTPETAKSAAVKYYASIIELKPEKEKLYRELHADVWPDVKAAIKKSNIRNFNIYVAEINGKKYLFSHFEYTGTDPEADFRAMLDDETTHDKWLPITDACQQVMPGTPEGQHWLPIEMLMHLE